MKLASKRLASLVLARFARGVVATDAAPGLVVKARAAEVLSLMQRAANKHALRRLAERTLLPRFDFGQMTRLAVGAAWFKASQKQQRALENGFRALLVSTYTTSLSSGASADMQLEVKPVRHSSTHEVIVKTLIKRAGAPAAAIDYAMEHQRSGWKVYDVLVDGVSLMTTYRETFIEELGRSGIDGLIKALNGKDRRRSVRHGSYDRLSAWTA